MPSFYPRNEGERRILAEQEARERPYKLWKLNEDWRRRQQRQRNDPPPAPGPRAAVRQRNRPAELAMAWGIASILLCFTGPFTLVLVVGALILGAFGIHRANQEAPNGRTAVAAMVCGCVGALGYVAVCSAGLAPWWS